MFIIGKEYYCVYSFKIRMYLFNKTELHCYIIFKYDLSTLKGYKKLCQVRFISWIVPV